MYVRPTLPQLYQRVRQTIDSFLGTKKRPRLSLVDILAKALAGLSHSLHGHIEFLAKNLLPDSARGLVLERWAAIFGVFRKRATRSLGKAEFTALAPNATVPVATVLQAFDLRYETTSEGVAVDGKITVDVISIDFGAEQNIDAGIQISLVNPIEGVSSDGIVASGGISGGAKEESDVQLRARLLERIRTPPKGGAVNDYIIWAKEVSGVTRVFVYPTRRGAGTVDVAFVTDDSENIIPDPNSEVFSKVRETLRNRAPTTAIVDVISLVEKKIVPEIAVFPDNPNVRKAVESEIKDLFRRESAAGRSDGSTGTIRISKLREAISQAEGEEYHNLLYPTEDITVEDTEIITFGGVNWQS